MLESFEEPGVDALQLKVAPVLEPRPELEPEARRSLSLSPTACGDRELAAVRAAVRRRGGEGEGGERGQSWLEHNG